MRIEIISTGDEIVTGLVVDTNAAWLSALLLEQGWQVRRRATVGDNLADLTVLDGKPAHVQVSMTTGGAPVVVELDLTLAVVPDASWGFCGG